MNKKIKSLFLIITCVVLISCSFDNKTGIWGGGKGEKERIANLEKKQKDHIKTVKVYSSDKTYSKEVIAKKYIKLTKTKANSSWDMSGLNLQNNLGHIYLPSIESIFIKKKIGKNKFSISNIISTPIIYNENIVFADDTGSIFSIDNNGHLNWKKNIYKKTFKKIYKNLAFSIYKDNIYIADNIGLVYSLNLESGNINWLKNHGTPIKSSIKVFKDKIFMINQDNRLLSFSIDDGSLIWDIRSISSFIKSQSFLSLAISKTGDLVVLFSSGDLLKVNANNGSIKWSFNTTGSLLAHDTDFFNSSDIVIAKNDIFFSTPFSTSSYNLNSGYFNWENKVGSINTPIVDGNNLFIVSNNGYFVNLNKQSGEVIWSTNILKILDEKKRNTYISGFVLGSGKIYAVSANGYLITCSATTGQVDTFKKIGEEVTTAPIISNGALYILTEKPSIVAFR